MEDERQDADAYLRAIAHRLRGIGLEVECERPEDAPAQAILHRAAALGADLIAMTTLGRGGLERLAFGSVADEVLRKAACPILLVRARDERRPSAEVPIL